LQLTHQSMQFRSTVTRDAAFGSASLRKVHGRWRFPCLKLLGYSMIGSGRLWRRR